MRAMKNTTKIICLCIIAMCILIFGIPVYLRKRDESIIQEELIKMQEVLERYEASMPEMLAERCSEAGFEVEGRYAIVAHTELKDNSEYARNNDDIFLYFYPNVSCEVTLYDRNASFDRCSDRAKYEMLRSLDKIVNSEHDRLLDEYFPQIQHDRDAEITKNARISYRNNGCDILIESAGHVYENARLVKDYYVLDGKDHFLRDRDSKWYIEPKVDDYGSGSGNRRSTGNSSNSGSGKKKDGYYSADDYADDYVEYYMEDGLDYDEAYEEAWDEWEE